MTTRAYKNVYPHNHGFFMSHQPQMPKLRDENNLLEFLKENHSISKAYLERYYRKETALCANAKEKLRALFIFALNASNSGSNLDNGAFSVSQFSNKISSIGTETKIPLARLCHALLGDAYNVDEKSTLVKILYDHLIMGYKQIGHKKAAMFLRDILYIGGYDIFTDVIAEEWFNNLIVPVDRVVRLMLFSYFKMSDSDSNENISKMIRENFPKDHMYFEDLWFWGHFALKKDEIQKFNGNEQMITMDMLLNPDLESQIRKSLPRFIEVICKTSTSMSY